MKNIEKYPNTKDALDAYNNLKTKGVTFDEWLKCEYEEPRRTYLLEAAEELKNILSQKDITLPDVAVAFSRLTDAIKREKQKSPRNFNKYKTPQEALKAFHLICDNMMCESCPYDKGSHVSCAFEWIYAKDGKEETK